MEQGQTKNILVNILTVVIVLGVLIVGYVVFTKKNSAGTNSTPSIPSAPSIALIAEETSSIGLEIDATVRDLKDLSRAVASSSVIFNLPAFKNLQDFTVAVPTEAIGGRTNPFIIPDWKIKMRALEEASAKSAGSTSGSTVVTTTTTTTSTSTPGTQSQASAGLLGDFSTGI